MSTEEETRLRERVAEAERDLDNEREAHMHAVGEGNRLRRALGSAHTEAHVHWLAARAAAEVANVLVEERDAATAWAVAAMQRCAYLERGEDYREVAADLERLAADLRDGTLQGRPLGDLAAAAAEKAGGDEVAWARELLKELGDG